MNLCGKCIKEEHVVQNKWVYKCKEEEKTDNVVLLYLIYSMKLGQASIFRGKALYTPTACYFFPWHLPKKYEIWHTSFDQIWGQTLKSHYQISHPHELNLESWFKFNMQWSVISYQTRFSPTAFIGFTLNLANIIFMVVKSKLKAFW